MTSHSLPSLIAYCNQEDPLREVWLWAQAAGLAISVAIIGGTMISITNGLAITYIGIMSRLCAEDFNLSAYAVWQEEASSLALFTGIAIATAAVFVKIWLAGRFGPSTVKRNLRLALDLDDATRLVQSLLPQEANLRQGAPAVGQPVFRLLLSHSMVCTRYLVIRLLYVDTNETAVLIDALPVLNGQWSLLSAFFSDFGRNKEQVEILLGALRPYMSNKRHRATARNTKKTSLGPSHEEILRDAPPGTSYTNRQALSQSGPWGRRRVG